MDSLGTPKFSWKAHRYTPHTRSVDWYWILGGIALIGTVVSILVKNYLLAVIIILGSGLMAILAKQEHKEIDISFTEKGIVIGSDVYLYSKILSFWVYTTKTGEQRIIIEFHRVLIPYMTIPLGENVSPKELRSFLKAYVREKEHPEPAIDSIMRNIKF